MKTFIPVYSSLMTIDHDNDSVKKVARNVSTCIDYAYIAPEDGKVCGKEVHEGDLILLMYPIEDDLGERTTDESCIVIINKDNDLTKYVMKRIEADKKRSEAYAKHADCGTIYDTDCKCESAN